MAWLALITAGLISTAAADTITLDTGGVVEGELAVYKYNGECQVSVTGGALAGSVLLVPCQRIRSFQRASAPEAPPVALTLDVTPPAPALEVEAVATPEPLAVLDESVVPEDAPEADTPVVDPEPVLVEEPAVAPLAAAEPVVEPVAPPAEPEPAVAPAPRPEPPVEAVAAFPEPSDKAGDKEPAVRASLPPGVLPPGALLRTRATETHTDPPGR